MDEKSLISICLNGVIQDYKPLLITRGSETSTNLCSFAQEINGTVFEDNTTNEQPILLKGRRKAATIATVETYSKSSKKKGSKERFIGQFLKYHLG